MTFSHIRALAEEQALQYNPDSLAPFPYENVMKKHTDLKVYFTALDDDAVAGAILFKEDEYSILVNTNKASTWQHFALAHELGHYFLHKSTLVKERALVDADSALALISALAAVEPAADAEDLL